MRGITIYGVLTTALAVLAVPAAADAPAARAAPGWRKVAFPGAGSDGDLLGVAAFSRRDAWAVGVKNRSKPAPSGLLLHWNGKKWAPTGAAAARYLVASGVAGSSGKDVWVIGNRAPGKAFKPAAAHWNGKKWGFFTLPSPDRQTSVTAVTVISPKDAWVAGSDGSVPYLARWNGRKWRRVDSPRPVKTDRYELRGLASAGSAGVWAVGARTRGSAETPLIQRWNGKKWTITPPPKGTAGRLTSVMAVSRTKVWASGRLRADFRPLVLRSDGVRWTRIKDVPGPLEAGETLAGDGAGGIWTGLTIGLSKRSGAAAARPGYGRWDGKKWQVVYGGTYKPEQGDPTASSLALVPGTRSVWAVGHYFTIDGTHYPVLELHGPWPS